VRSESDILCEAIRSISKDRLVVRWGTVSHAIMEAVADRLRILMRL
jgi:mRNA interferase MazF